MDHLISQEFYGLKLGDLRLGKRVRRVAELLMARPDASFPAAIGTETELEGVYRLVNNGKTSLSSLVAPHLQQSATRVSSAAGVPVIAHDTTQFRFGVIGEDAELQRTGLGPLSKGGQGFFLHVALAVTGDDLRDPLGVVGTHSWARPCPSGNEFLRWGEGVKRVRTTLGTSRVIHVMDREADSYALYCQLLRVSVVEVRHTDDSRPPVGRLTLSTLLSSDFVRMSDLYD